MKIKRLINNSQLTSRQRTTLNALMDELKASEITVQTRLSYVLVLKTLGVYLGKPFKETTKLDLVGFINHVKGRLKASTVELVYKPKMKRFYKWLRTGSLKGHKYPEEVDWITIKGMSNKMPVRSENDLIGDKEVEKLILSATTIMEKAFVSTLWDSGCRIRELLDLDLTNVNIDRYGAVLFVDGKTGERRVRLVKAAPYLQVWLNHHPLRNFSRNVPLWVSRYNGKWNRYSYSGAFKLVTKKLPKRSGMPYRNPHLYRHSKATRYAKGGMSEFQMDKFFGWTYGSKAPARYIHLAGGDLDETVLRLEGKIKEPQRVVEKALQPIECGRCNKENPGDASFCYGCGLALSENANQTLSVIESIHTKIDIVLQDEKKAEELLHLLSATPPSNNT